MHEYLIQPAPRELTDRVTTEQLAGVVTFDLAPATVMLTCAMCAQEGVSMRVSSTARCCAKNMCPSHFGGRNEIKGFAGIDFFLVVETGNCCTLDGLFDN